MRAYGWTTRGKVVESEARELRSMAERVASGEPIRHIVVDLNDRGVRTVSGARWAHRTITRSVQNPRIVGLRERDGQLQPDPDVEPILDVDLWKKVCERLGDADRQKFTPMRRRQALLAGVMVCGLCESPMYLTGPNYACGNIDCTGVFIRQAMAETEVSERVLVRITSQDWLDALTHASAMGATHYRQIIDKARDRMVTLAEEFGRGVHTEAFNAGLAAARRVQSDAERDLALVHATGGARSMTPDDVIAWWGKQASDEDHRAVITAVVDRVSVAPRSQESGQDRLQILWNG